MCHINTIGSDLESSDELIALDEFRLGRNRHLTEVKYLAEKWLPCRPLDHFILGEEEQTEGKSHQEDHLEQVNPEGV